MSLTQRASSAVREVGDMIECPPAPDFESYTDAVERITKLLSKRPQGGTVALRLPSRAGTGAMPTPRTPEALLGWEKALGELQQASQLIVALVDGPIDDLTLSFALACDVRVGTPSAAFVPALDSAPSAIVPTWWLASLAYHTGAMRAAQLLKRGSAPAAAAELVAAGLLRGIVSTVDLPAYLAKLVPTDKDAAPRGSVLLLLRRILLQSFSLQNSDGIGHALAANSLLIAAALERLQSAPASPLLPMQPLGFEIREEASRWELSLIAELDNVAIDELLRAVGGLSKKLEKHVNDGQALPAHLLLRLRVSTEAPVPPVMPVQLLHEQAQPTDDRILRWLTRWEKVLASLSTLPLPTVAHLYCEAGATGTASLAALQLAFACDLRVASPNVRLAFCCGSLLPGTMTFRLAKHVGAGRAMSLLTLPGAMSAQEAVDCGALQLVAAEVPANLLAAPAVQGPKLLLCRSLLDATWHSSLQTISEQLQQFSLQTSGGAAGATSAKADGGSNLPLEMSEALSSFLPDQFMMPTDSWVWRLNFAAPGTGAAGAPAAAAALGRLPSREQMGLATAVGFSAEEQEGALLCTFSTELLSSPALVEFVAVLRSLSAQMAHGARGLVISVPPGLALGSAPELQRLWASALDELAGLVYPSCAVLEGALSPHALELALACRTRMSLRGGAPLSFALDYWRAASAPLPSARLWQLVRSAGIGAMARLLLCTDAAADADTLTAWGVLDGAVDDSGGAASAILARSPASLNGGAKQNGGSEGDDSVLVSASPPAEQDKRAEAEKGQLVEKLLEALPRVEMKGGAALLDRHLPQLVPPTAGPAIDTPSLSLSWEGAVAVVCLNRPSKANAYDTAMLEALDRLVAECELQRTPAVIFTSSDPRFFCAGADLARVSNPTAADALHMASQRAFDRLNKASFVSIAVVEGAAVAGGFEWALACDARIAGPGARFWLPEVHMNLIPSAGGCARLSELVGSARAKQLILFGDKLEAATAEAWGVVRAVSAAPLDDARKLAATLAGSGGLARQMAKQVIDHAGGGLDSALLLERVSEAALYEAKRRPRCVLLGVGTSAPPERYSQSEIADLLAIKDPRLRALFGASHIAGRCLAEMQTESKMETVTQGYLLAKHLRWAKRMAEGSVPTALAAAGVRLEQVNYLCVCTTTGFLSPGLSAHIAQHLGLHPFIQRADIVGMGCHAGINGLRTTGQWAEANPGQVALLVCVEVCSAGYHWDKGNPEMSVALTNSLFGDGCAAAVLRCPADSANTRSLEGGGALQPTIYGYEAMLLPNTLDALCYNWIEEHSKYSFIIQPAVPYLIGLQIPKMVDRLLERFKLKKSDIAHWVVHSGGKKVLDCVQYSLGLSRHDIRHSLSSLEAMGNMSSCSFLWAYDSLQREGVAKPGDYGLFITMGPGAGIECALWRLPLAERPPPR